MARAMKILVACDASDAAQRALAYVGKVVEGRPDTTIRLFHLLPPIPPRYLEHGGADEPAAERALDARLREERERWVAEREAEAQPLLDRARRLLAPLGLGLETECRPSVGGPAVARQCLEAARESGCDTIVLARQSFPWHRELFHHHQSDELVRRGRGLAVWVVE